MFVVRTILATTIIIAMPQIALCADILGSKSTTATLTINGAIKTALFEKAKDSDWYKVQLTKGNSYAIRIDSGAPYNAVEPSILGAVRSSTGASLASAIDDPDTVGGFTYTAVRTGTHFVEYKHLGGAPLPTGYQARIETDCSSDSKTKCSLTTGTERKGVFNYAQDIDWFKVNLIRTRSYILSGSSEIGFYANIANASGTIVWPSWAWIDGSTVSFQPPADGTYYILTGGEDDYDYQYRVLLR